MDDREHKLGQAVLTHVLRGRALVGMHFRASNLWFGETNGSGREVFLRVENHWGEVARGEPWPMLDQMCPHTDWYQLGEASLRLAEGVIDEVVLSKPVPDLRLDFSTGRSLVVRGASESFESWELSAEEFTVVALAGNGLATWCPEGFGAG